MSNQARQDRWVFGDRDVGASLVTFAWTKIVRQQKVTGTSSPDDRPCADAGLIGAARRQHRRWTDARSGSCTASTGVAGPAGSTSCTPITNHEAA